MCGDAAEEARAERGAPLDPRLVPTGRAEYARNEGRTAARAILARDYSRPLACRWEMNGPSLTRARLAHAWCEGFREVKPPPTGELTG